MKLKEKREKLEAIVSEQKEIIQSKVGEDSFLDAFKKLARLRYLEMQKHIIEAIPTKKLIPKYAKGAIVGSNDKPEMIKLNLDNLKASKAGYSTDTDWYVKNSKSLPATNSFREYLEQTKPAN